MTVSSNVMSKRAVRTLAVVIGFVLAAAVMPSPTRATNGPHPKPTEQRGLLLNGLPIVTQPTAGDRVAVVLIARAGAMFDPAGKSGLAALTARLLRTGAGSYSGERIAAELADAGATLEIDPRWDGIWFVAEAPAANLSSVLDVLSLMVTAPRFEETAFETARKSAIAQATERETSTEVVAQTALARALYGSHTYGRQVEGSSASLGALTLGDVKVHFSKFYGGGSAVLGVAGPQTLDDVMRLAKPRFGRWTKGKTVPATFLPPTPATSTRVFIVDMPDATKAAVALGLLTPGRGDRSMPAYQGLTTALVKESIARVPEGTHPAVGWDLRILQSPFWVSYRVQPSDVATSVEAVRDSMRALQSGSWQGDARVALPSGLRQTALALASKSYYESQQLASTGAAETSALDVAAAARVVLKPDALTVVVVAKAADVVEPLKAKGFAVEVVPKP
jgi:hypothetical protein